MNADNQSDAIYEAIFEDALRRMSGKALNALIACSVFDMPGFLRITEEDLRRAGIARRVSDELMHLRQRIEEEVEKSCRDAVTISIVNGSAGEAQHGVMSCSDGRVVSRGTPISDSLLGKLTPGVLGVLYDECVQTCEQLLKLQPRDLFASNKIGTREWKALERLQKKIIQEYPSLSYVARPPVHHPGSKGEGHHSAIESHDVSTIGQRSPFDPAEWSVLAKTIPGVFDTDQSLFSGNDFTAADDQPTIACLGFSAADIEALRATALFPEDPVEMLLCCSTGYLLQANLSEDGLKTVLKYFAHVLNAGNRPHMEPRAGNISDKAIFADTPINSVADLPVPNAGILSGGADVDNNITWKEISVLSEQSLIQSLGFTIQGLRAISHVWNLKEKARALARERSKWLPVEAYCSFEALVDGFIQLVARRKREVPPHSTVIGVGC